MGLYFRMIKCSKIGCDMGSQVYVKPQGQDVQKADDNDLVIPLGPSLNS